MKEQTVVVASKNAVKVNAALDSFQRLFADDAFLAIPLEVPSGVSEQPITDEVYILN